MAYDRNYQLTPEELLACRLSGVLRSGGSVAEACRELGVLDQYCSRLAWVAEFQARSDAMDADPRWEGSRGDWLEALDEHCPTFLASRPALTRVAAHRAHCERVEGVS